MEMITQFKVLELIKQLPEAKLPIVYQFLQQIVNDNVAQATFLREPMRHSIDERRRILSSEAERLKSYYQKTAEDRQDWQSGDFMDGYQSRRCVVGKS